MLQHELENAARIARAADERAVKFQPGRAYWTRSICDHECIYVVRVLKRTAKTVTGTCDGGPVQTWRPYLYDGVETIAPKGRYSMAPTVSADRPTLGLPVEHLARYGTQSPSVRP